MIQEVGNLLWWKKKTLGRLLENLGEGGQGACIFGQGVVATAYFFLLALAPLGFNCATARMATNNAECVFGGDVETRRRHY